MSEFETPKTMWKDLPSFLKGKMLLAHQEKQAIQVWINGAGWADSECPQWLPDNVYRIKPEVNDEQAKTTVLHGNGKSWCITDKPRTPDDKFRVEITTRNGDFIACEGNVLGTVPAPKEPETVTVTTYGTWCKKGQMPKTQYQYRLVFQLDDNGHPDWKTARASGV